VQHQIPPNNHSWSNLTPVTDPLSCWWEKDKKSYSESVASFLETWDAITPLVVSKPFPTRVNVSDVKTRNNDKTKIFSIKYLPVSIEMECRSPEYLLNDHSTVHTQDMQGQVKWRRESASVSAVSPVQIQPVLLRNEIQTFAQAFFLAKGSVK